MKSSAVLPAVLAGLGLVLFAVVLVLGGGTVLYEAADDAYSDSHKDVNAVSVMTTQEADTILPLMAEIMLQSSKIALEIDSKDFEYSERELQEYANLLNRLKTNNAKIKLGNTEINDFRLSSEELKIALEVLNSDVARVEELKQQIRENPGDASSLAAMYAEIQVLSKEISLTAETYTATADSMITAAQSQNLDTVHLEQATANVNKIAADALSGVNTLRPGSDLQILFTLSEDTFVYGDTLKIDGSSRISGLHEIYLDSRVLGTVNLTTTDTFTKSFRITNVSAGKHTVSIRCQDAVSKQAEISVLSTNSTVFISSADVSGNTVTITGALKTADDVFVSGAKVDVYADGIGLLGTNTTNKNGVFSVQTELTDGEYLVYAEFADFSFPLEESVSEPVEVSVSPSFLIPILAAAVLGIAAFIGVRIFRKRKLSGKSLVDAEDSAVLKTAKPSPVKKVMKTIRRIINSSENAADSDKLRILYRETVSVISSYEGIKNTAVKTPREILQEIKQKSYDIEAFMAEYEYLHYADIVVSDADLEKMKGIAAKILEGYHENNE